MTDTEPTVVDLSTSASPVPVNTQEVPPEVGTRRDRWYAALGAISLVGLVAVGSVSAWPKPVTQRTPPVVAAPVVVQPHAPTTPNPFDAVHLEARAAIVYDVRSGKELYRLNDQERLPLASLTKLMTALVAYEDLPKESKVAITPNAIDTEGDSGLIEYDTWNLKDLLAFTLITSSNDGADALAAAAGAVSLGTTSREYEKIDSFVDHMNERASTIGLTNTVYRNPTGLDESAVRAGGVGTAHDVAKLLAYITDNAFGAVAASNHAVDTFSTTQGIQYRAENTNEHVDTIPGLLASKTGYTDLAGGNLAVLYDAGLNQPIAVVVLGSSIEGRFSDVDTLVSATSEYLSSGWYEYTVAGSTHTTP